MVKGNERLKIVAYKKLLYDIVRIELYKEKEAFAIFDLEYQTKTKRNEANEYHLRMEIDDVIKLHEVLGEYIDAKENVRS